jgi:NAD(P)-dependent dehydrogenase (short-subunit alcohol dehydrogenase family)
MPSVLITGASRGIGLEFATQYLTQGWHVYAACRNPASAQKLQQLAQAKERHIDLLTMDVIDAAGIRRAAANVGGAIDVLINNAGIAGKHGETIGSLDYVGWAQVFDVNTMGPIRVTEAFIEHVARSDRKLVVTITSGLGSIADNTSGGWIAYRTSKAAVNMAMRCAAIDLAPRGISCVVVNPGWVRTDMTDGAASMSATESVTALRAVIETLGPAESGKYFHYDGREYPW